jgi:hypothetical protein
MNLILHTSCQKPFVEAGSERADSPAQTARNPVDRVGLNIVEVCCRKTTRRLKSREFLRMGRCRGSDPEEISGSLRRERRFLAGR